MGRPATIVRRALLTDAAAIAAVHFASWKTSYEGILPDSFLAAQSLADRTATWRQRLLEPGPKVVIFVACGPQGEAVGFAWGGPARSDETGCEGELYSIYLLKEAQGLGTGTLLLKNVVRSLIEGGLRSMAVWTLAANRSRSFYEALGGRLIAERSNEYGTESFKEVAYGWTDLTTLCAPNL